MYVCGLRSLSETQVSRSASMLILLCPPTLTPRSKATTTVMAASFSQRQVHRLARRGGAPCGIENLHRNQVGFKRGQAIRLCTIENHSAELRQRIVIGRRQRLRHDQLLFASRT